MKTPLVLSMLALTSCIQQPFCPELKEPAVVSQGMKRSSKPSKKNADSQASLELAKVQKLKTTLERLKSSPTEFRPKEDLTLLETLKLEKPSSTQNALMLLLLAHRAYNDTSFSFAQEVASFGLDLPSNLINNPELNTLQSSKLFLEISKNLDSESQALIRGALAQLFASWDELKASSSTPQPAADVAAPSPTPKDFPAATLPAVMPQTPAPAEAEQAKPLTPDPIRESQPFVDKAQYAEAIRQLSLVKQEDTFFAKAQQRIKEISNLGVQDLRKKAAKAFQSAVPLTDIRTKSSYLTTAKTYLEEALEQFPSADQLQTVRDNLAVITQNLDQLAKK